MANYQIWFRRNNANWNNNPSADPATNTGGIDFSAMEGTPVSPIMQGSGDGGVTCNFGASPFSYSVPPGYTAGWPASGGGFTKMDPTLSQGSGALSGGDLVCTFETVAGLTQSPDYQTSGMYYFEYRVTAGDVFTNSLGGGVGRQFQGAGGDYNHWLGNGGFNGSSNLGGATVIGGDFNLFHANLSALGSVVVADAFSYAGSGTDVIGVAVFLTSGGPPTGSSVTIADLWFGNPGSFVDITLVGNRRKFISEAGCTVNLASDGSAPFGRSPAIFLTVPSGGVAAQFADNNGNGGDFIITGGTLALAGNMPCCTTTTLTVTNPPSLGVGVLGDYQNGNLYAFNMDTLLDNGTQRKWLRRWRALEKPREETTRFASLRVDMETGSPQNPPSTSPSVVLRYSDDGGHTFSAPRIIPAGPVGATAQNVKANMLGSTARHARSDRIFELSSTDEQKIALVGAEIEVS